MAQPIHGLTYDSYTVAFICPMGVELAAVAAMLDEIHPTLPCDKNSYTLGRIGPHNVVVAVMPEIGNNNAATVATQLMNDFRSVRFGLLVGIGGGIPVKDAYDIRLGDVVVSKPSGTFGGVVQFDRGKSYGDGRFERTGMLNKPPTVIMASLETLRAQHIMSGNQISRYVSKMLEKFPAMEQAQYFYQGVDQDLLFESTYHHRGDSSCDGCDRRRVVRRLPRETTSPRIHYGTIGSANQVVKDAVTRERLREDLGIICVEMEAAGLMDAFPCLVVRGICDYADSHKNKRWQPYAAATAAAFAKELLLVVPTAEVATACAAESTNWSVYDFKMTSGFGSGLIYAFHCRNESDFDLLPSVAEAAFNSYDKQHDPLCLDGTRTDVLDKIHEWADGDKEKCIFWLNGLAGTGKSTIARTVARDYSDRGRLGASFFFSRGGGDVSHAGKFFTSIAVQLARRIPTLRRYICEAIAEYSDIASQSLRDQWRKLILRPLSKLDGNGYQSYVLVVDALDECDNDNNIRIILQLLAEARSLKTVRLRIFLTSRPEIPIRYGICQIPDSEHEDFVLHNISPSIIDHDIYVFLEYNLRLIGQEYALDAGWPDECVIRRLVQNASGLFIWAATACRFIQEGREFAERRLSVILQSEMSVTAPERRLYEIYITVLTSSIGHQYNDEERDELLARLRTVLGNIVVLSSPLSASSLSRLLHTTKQQVDQTLNHLHAILDIPKDQTRPLRLHHPSFRDFLLEKERCGDLNFWVDEKEAHQILASRCISLLSSSLGQDICGLGIPGVLVTDIQSSRVEKCLPPEVQYACLYWVQHLQKSGELLHDDSQIHQFLQVHLLHWLEALSLIRKITEGILAIISLESITLVSFLGPINLSINND